MENHPIPQDVTGFQFKLIGDMTVKQFAYLATGIVLAWTFFQLPIFFIIKLPVCALLALLGIGLAFIPIAGRPMDVMIGNFIKALLRPTQFVYEKKGAPFFSETSPLATKQNPAIDPSRAPDPYKPMLSAQRVASAPTHKPDPVHISVPIVTMVDSQSNPLAPPAEELITAPPPAADKKPALQMMQMKIQRPASFAPQQYTPDSPNLIVGAARDSRGNPLPNILIEVKDKDKNPIRAFKTNEVGRFASATPILNGTYTIEFEDPRGQNRFETTTINATGQIIPPIIAVSVDAREELRKSLFAGASI